jgi:replicative DNA helicase
VTFDSRTRANRLRDTVVDARELLEDVAWDPRGPTHPRAVHPTGLDILDDVLGGGLRSHELALVAGRPGVGKTVLLLQVARHLVGCGRTVIFASYEHEPMDLLWRLLVAELADEPSHGDPAQLRLLLRQAATVGDPSLEAVSREHPEVAAACYRVSTYGHRLRIMSASAAAGLPALASAAASGADVVIVDYLQKIPAVADHGDRVALVAEGLKSLALDQGLAIVAAVAADRTGLAAPRLRLQHLEGSTMLAYESDIVLTLADKIDVVSRIHLTYDSLAARRFRDMLVCTVEKNRNGPAPVDLEFTKDLANFRLDRRGAYVPERLVDERVVVE